MDLLTDKGAIFNDERTHRHKLWRTWNAAMPVLMVVGMNPSKADENDNDPTVERVERRARILGYGGIVMLNVQDIIETDSRRLAQIPADVRCTSANAGHLIDALEAAKAGAGDILCAWGKPGQKYGPIAWFTTQAFRRGVTLFCLKTNKDGSPVHPLYQPYAMKFKWFGGVSAINAALPLVVANTAS